MNANVIFEGVRPVRTTNFCAFMNGPLHICSSGSNTQEGDERVACRNDTENISSAGGLKLKFALQAKSLIPLLVLGFQTFDYLRPP